MHNLGGLTADYQDSEHENQQAFDFHTTQASGFQSTAGIDEVESTTQMNAGGSTEDEKTNTPSSLQRVYSAIRQATTVAGLFRLSGATLMVVALSLFLIQGVEATSDLQRYFLLLGQTALLTLAGFGVGFLLKEPRGARVFFSLGLISIPANFAVLGALIYSIAPWDSMLTDYPSYATWTSASISELIMAAGAGLAVLVPMAAFCFAVMARHSKYWLTTAYLLSSATLLIPVRETFSITIISSISVIAVIALLARKRSKVKNAATGEERFAQALLFLPAGLLLARSAMLYNIEFHFVLSVVLCVYYFMRHLVKNRTQPSKLTTLLQVSTLALSIVLAVMLTSLVSDQLSFALSAILFSGFFGILLIELSRWILATKVKSLMLTVWSLLSLLPLLLASLFGGGLSILFASLFVSASVLGISVYRGHTMGTLLGVTSLVVILISFSQDFVDQLMASGWLGIAIAGATIIVTGSLIERFWPTISLGFKQRFRRTDDGADSSMTKAEELAL